MRPLAFAATAVTLLLAACGGPADRGAGATAAASPDTLRYTRQVVERTQGSCRRSGVDTADLPCVSVAITYPAVDSAPVPALAEAVRAFVLATAGAVDEAPPPATVDSAAIHFVAQYEDAASALASGGERDFPEVWSLQRDVSVVCNTPDMLSLRAEEYRYTGGAHGLQTVRLASFDPHTGRRLQLADMVTDTAALVPIAERAFREQKKIPEGQALSEAGYEFFEQDRFALTDNVMRCGDTLTVHYDPYQIAPYALGPTELVLTGDEVGALLKGS